MRCERIAMSDATSHFVDEALLGTCAVGVIRTTPWSRDRNTEIILQDGTHLHAIIMGSGFFLDASTGLLLTAEHVRRDCRKLCNENASKSAKLVVCPYLGGELNWSHAWEAKVVAHTGSWNPTDSRDLPEPGLEAEMVLTDLVDAALLRPKRELMTDTLVSAPVCIPGTGKAITALRISTAPLKTIQNLYALGFPVAGGKMTPTPIDGNYSLVETSPHQATGTFLKFTGAEILPGHSGGPVVTNSGVCVAWNVRNHKDLPMGGVNHVRPIEAAQACIELAMGTNAWPTLLATPAQEAAHEASIEQARAAAGAAAGAETGAIAGMNAGSIGAAEELARAARVAEEAAKQRRVDADHRVATLTASAQSVWLPHSPKLSPDSPDARQLFGRDHDVAKLAAALRDGKSVAKYCLVMGSAGLGKTELVLAAARALVKGEESDVVRGTEPPRSRFSAILFVELRAADSADQVESRVEKAINELQGVDRSVLADPAQRAKRLSGALLILDNADDPYERSCKGIGGEKGWFEKRLLDTYEGWGCRLLLTIRDETESALFKKASMRNRVTQRLEPLAAEAGQAMLRHEMVGVEPELTEVQENSILELCGARGMSPLALSVICGVLRYEFDEQLFTKSDRSSYLADLGSALVRADSNDFSKLQTVVKHSIERVPAADRAAFLQLHLFPDRFTVSDAAALWARDEEDARLLLLRLKKASLVDCALASPQPYLVLDHLWHFVDAYAQDPQSEWLNRTEQAGAIKRLIELGHKTGAANERLLSAARAHAVQVLRVVYCLREGLTLESFDEAAFKRELVAKLGATISSSDITMSHASYRSLAEDVPAVKVQHDDGEGPGGGPVVMFPRRILSFPAEDVPASNKKRKHDVAPDLKGIGPISAAYKERKLVAGQGPSASSSRTMPCGARKACQCCHAGLSKFNVNQTDGLVQAAQALMRCAPIGQSHPGSLRP
jgi:hypothetical protein